jgi:hypothetical protein
LDNCCVAADTKTQELNSKDINESKSSACLFQNTPNPHQGYTVIRYFVPEVANNVELQFFDMGGQLVKTIPINQLGFSEVQLNASDMANGMYTYGLMVDGKIIDMKKMIKE